MKNQPDILKALKPVYFWDVDAGSLDAQKSKRLIIERVFRFGYLEEIAMLIDFYGDQQIVETFCKVNYLDPKTLNFVSKLFKTPLEKFKCYTKAQLTRPLWNS